TTPALVMGAASCDLPTIVVSGGPMLNGRHQGKTVGSGTSVFEMSEAVRAGCMSECEFRAAESAMSRSPGHCNTMGTASTMASLVETLGLTLPSNAAIPAVDSRRRVLARDSGVRIVEMVAENLTMSSVVDRNSFENAIKVNTAIGGSTNAVVHLLAIAGRLEIPLELSDFGEQSRGVPLLANLMPSGTYLMEDFFYAGGLPAVIAELGDILHLDAATVTGKTLGENNSGETIWDDDVIRSTAAPLLEQAGIAVLTGNLAPNGAVIKPSAASPELLSHVGRAVVFHGMDDFTARVDSPDLDIEADDVIVLTGAGPKGFPGMPEVGNLPLPRRLLERGVRDMVRISDARMSGTAFGTVVLHVAPEADAGGPLGAVRDGDLIELDVARGVLRVLVDDDELARRLEALPPRVQKSTSGYQRLFVDHVMQADRGVDFDFLVGRRGTEVHGDNH
ncbi:MAG: L-arabonate dehydrase, partial [Rhodococcus sp. (in: high G+C Gram-positive bacteria)]